MIDLHCHILPYIDDGPETLQETLEMCRMAVADGITTIVATPHQQNGVYENSAKAILKKVEEVALELKNTDIALELLPGADVFIDVHTGDKIAQGEIMTVNNTGRYFLLEFPAHSIPPNIEKIIFNILLKNITPILTHPERIAEVQEYPDKIYNLICSGVLSQITAMSLTGEFGPRAQKCAKILLKHHLAHIIATDAHSVAGRPPLLSKAVDMASRIVGHEEATEMVTTIPLQVIRGEPVLNLPPPLPLTRKRFWFF
ncbi:PHP C-terminal domain protein [Candidatus Vecturithrix granuli]|uniref:protein-tyrosine-phosphatase n=1 Tax=Vecturithrix granuli TaxID=1499967 RepID=A0A081C592_VECG1|nr:PHP C-terminal domain protein [Candidatus Vecturithrix granuli]